MEKYYRLRLKQEKDIFTVIYITFVIIVSPDKSQRFLDFSMVRLPRPAQPPQRLPYKVGMWVYTGKASDPIVLYPWSSIIRPMAAF